jgi:hypothetical protein
MIVEHRIDVHINAPWTKTVDVGSVLVIRVVICAQPDPLVL